MTASRDSIRQAIFSLGPHIRYVAFGDGQDVSTAQRDDVAAPSDETSDFFEELLVNPVLLTLARQRGELDCGGLRHIVIAYGNFNQLVMPLPSGQRHVSICVELGADVDEVARQVFDLVAEPRT